MTYGRFNKHINYFINNNMKSYMNKYIMLGVALNWGIKLFLFLIPFNRSALRLLNLGFGICLKYNVIHC